MCVGINNVFYFPSDGRSVWEVEARVVPEKSSGVSRNIALRNNIAIRFTCKKIHVLIVIHTVGEFF